MTNPNTRASGLSNRPSQVKRVARYYRVSTEDQLNGYGIEVQEKGLDQVLGEREDLETVEVYKDLGVTGTISNRHDFMRLEEDARAGLFDVVAVHKIDRIARKKRVFNIWMYGMEDLGISVIATSQGIDTTTRSGRLAADIFATISEEEWKLIRARTNDGRQMKAEAGGWVGGPAPFGYVLVGKGARGSHLEVNPDELGILEIAAGLAIQGFNAGEVARKLSGLGLTTRDGRSWTRRNVRKLLTSDSALRGISIFRKTETKRDGRPQTHVDSEGKPIFGETVTIRLPELLDEKTRTDLAAALALSSRATVRKSPVPHILTGQLLGTCGERYTGSIREEGRAREYRCIGRETLRCSDPVLDADAVEELVWHETVKLLQDADRVRQLVGQWASSLPQEHETYQLHAESIQGRVTKLERSLERAVKLAIESDDPNVVEAANALKAQTSSELNECRADLDHVEAWLRAYDQSFDEVQQLVALADTARLSLQELSPHERRTLIRALDVQATVLETEFARPRGRKCAVMAWHLSTGTLVPAEVDEPTWADLRKILIERHGPHHFHLVVDPLLTLNAILYRLRTDIVWSDLPAEYGSRKQAYKKQYQWWNAGTWPLIVEMLNKRGGGSPAPQPVLLPPIKVRGLLSLDLMTTGMEQAADAATAARTGKKATLAAPGPMTSSRARCSSPA